MRIGFDAKRAFNNRTGLGNYSRQLIEGIIKYSSDDLCYLFTPKIDRYIEEQWATFLKHPSVQIITPQNIFYQTLHQWWRSHAPSQLSAYNRLNIYHGLSNELPIGMNQTFIKTVVTIHDLIFLRHPEFFNKTDRLIYQRKFQYACENADKIIATSETTKNDIIHFFKIPHEKIEVIYQNCNQIFYEPKNQLKDIKIKQKYQLPEQYILLVSKTDFRKNHLNFLKAYNNLNPHHKIPIVLVGSAGDQHREVMKYIHQHQLKVHYLNYVDYEDLPTIYDGCLFSVYPSMFEGFGIPLVESMARGKAILTSTESCFEEIAGKTAVFANPNRIDEIQEQLETLLKQPELIKNLENNISKQLVHFESEKNTKILLNLYKSLL